MSSEAKTDVEEFMSAFGAFVQDWRDRYVAAMNEFARAVSRGSDR